MKKKLFLMSGCPASGKSTYIKTHGLNKNSKVVSRDKIRFSLLKDEEDYFAHEKQTFNLFVQQTQEYLDNDETTWVFADATFLTDKSRKKFLNRLNLTDDIEIHLVIMDTSLYTCLDRNACRTGRERVPDEAIIDGWIRHERQTAIERINETHYFMGEGDDCTYDFL